MDAVNIKQLNNLSRGIREKETFNYKSGRLNFNRYGIYVIYKSPADNVAVEILTISEGESYLQQPIVTKNEYTLFIPPVKDIITYTDKEY